MQKFFYIFFKAMQNNPTNDVTVVENGPKKRVQSKWYQYPGINLRFLLDFMKAVGLNTEALCKPTGQPPQSLRIQLKRDDMKLSKAKRLIESNGYKLEIRYIPKEKNTEEDNYIVTLPHIVKKKENKRDLDFIKDFIASQGDSQYALAEKIGVTQGAVFAWFNTDDILISYIIKIKEAYDVNLEFRITENTENSV